MPKYTPVGKVTPPKTWSEIKYERMAFVLRCEVKGCTNAPAHAHHVFLRRDRRRLYKKAVDQAQNMQIVCEECHMNGTANSWKNQQEFMVTQMRRYDMEGWWNTIPSKKQQTNKDIGGLI